MNTPSLRVLLAEQEFSETGLTLRSLCAEVGWSLEMVFVDSRSDLAHALLAHCPDVAFLQLDLLRPDAPGLLRVLHRSYPSIPFILFADPADRDCAVSCLSTGARDFMLEGFMDSRTMARALRSAGVQHPVNSADALSLARSNRNSSLGMRSGSYLPMVPKHDLALTVSIEEPSHLIGQPDDEIRQRVLRDFEHRLRSIVRLTDGVVRVGPWQWTLHFWCVPETAAEGIVARVKTGLAEFGSHSLSHSAFVFSLAAEKSSSGEISGSDLSDSAFS